MQGLNLKVFLCYIIYEIGNFIGVLFYFLIKHPNLILLKLWGRHLYNDLIVIFLNPWQVNRD